MQPIDIILSFEYALILYMLLFVVPGLVGMALMRRGAIKASLPWTKASYALCRFIPHWRTVMAVNLGGSYLHLGEDTLARTYLEESLRRSNRFANSFDIKNTRALAKAYLGVLQVREGQYAGVESLFQEALAAKLNRRYRPFIVVYASSAYIHLGKFAEADALLHELLETPKLGAEFECTAHCNRSFSAYYQNRMGEALQAAQAAAQHPSRFPSTQAVMLVAQILAHIGTGDLEGAKKFEIQALTLVSIVAPFTQSAIYRAIAELALRLDNLDRARDYAERASSLTMTPNGQANILLIQAEVFAARNNANRAETLCRDVLQLECLPFYRERAVTLIARLEHQNGI